MSKAPLARFLAYRVMTASSFFGVLAFWLIASESLRSVYDAVPTMLHHFWLAVLLVVLVFGLLSWLSLVFAANVFPAGNTMEASEIKPIENIAMPTYIGMFVIALEIGDLEIQRSVAVLALLLVLWGLFERVFYFNPVWLFFGYRFYEARTSAGNTFTVIARRKNLKGEVSFTNLRKINEYTYLETD